MVVVAFLSPRDRNVRQIHRKCSVCGSRGGSGGAVVEATGRGFGGNGGERDGCLFATTAPCVASPTRSIAALASLLRPVIAPALSNSLSRNACTPL